MLSQMEVILYALAGAFWVYHLVNIFDTYSRAARLKEKPLEAKSLPPISIIIAAKNEYDNLVNLIPELLNQDYPHFEIVLMNDGSMDETDSWASQFALKESRLKYTYMDPDFLKVDGKKIALTLGIKKAQHDHFVFLDGDCQIKSNQYLKEYGKAFSSGKNLILGISPYLKSKGLLNKLIQFETFTTAASYLSFASKKKPYMGVGRNMGYTKGLYNSVNGFESHYDVPCGDDDLFVQSVQEQCKVSVLLSEESKTYSPAKQNWKAYKSQKLRHLWAGKYYKTGVKTKLMRIPLSNYIFWLFVLSAILINYKFLIGAILILLKFITKWIVYHVSSKKRMKEHRISYYPIVSIVHFYFQIFMGIKLYFTKKISW